jgi:TatA/E family protein of Tat protein translocase
VLPNTVMRESNSVLVLLIFGAKSIPGLAKGLGQGLTEFRKATKHEDEKPADTDKKDA